MSIKVSPSILAANFGNIERECDLIDEQKKTLEKIIIRSLFGNINASRNPA